MITATAVSQTPPHSVEVRKISEQDRKKKRQPPCLRKLDVPPAGRNYLFLGSTVFVKMLSKSLKPVFLQMTPNGAVPTLCKAKTSRANLQECRDLQLRSIILVLPADELLHHARYSGGGVKNKIIPKYLFEAAKTEGVSII